MHQKGPYASNIKNFIAQLSQSDHKQQNDTTVLTFSISVDTLMSPSLYRFTLLRESFAINGYLFLAKLDQKCKPITPLIW